MRIFEKIENSAVEMSFPFLHGTSGTSSRIPIKVTIQYLLLEDHNYFRQIDSSKTVLIWTGIPTNQIDTKSLYVICGDM